MSLLAALARHYRSSPNAVPPGWTVSKVSWCVVLDRAGAVVEIEDLRCHAGDKPRARELLVPWSQEAAKRTFGIVANLFVDKTAYALGRTAGASRRVNEEHADFRHRHLALIEDNPDPGLSALAAFLVQWQPESLETISGYCADMLDTRVVFRLEGDLGLLHERPAAGGLIAGAVVSREEESPQGHCLIDGTAGPIARLHRMIMGVHGGQAAGAALVSSNCAAFESHGWRQGLNSPTGRAAAFEYAAGLNELLRRDGGHRLERPVGDMTLVHWAEDSSGSTDPVASAMLGDWLRGVFDAKSPQAAALQGEIEAIAAGARADQLRPNVANKARVHILGLSPNVARLAVRVWIELPLDEILQNLAAHDRDCRIVPGPAGWGVAPSLDRLLLNVAAVHRERANVPHGLAGEVTRSVLLGLPYPRSLLTAVLMRLRAGDNIASGWHAAVVRGILAREARRGSGARELPVCLDRSLLAPGYVLGRLFALHEAIERADRGHFSLTVRDTRLAVATASPARIFPLLDHGTSYRLARLRGTRPQLYRELEADLREVRALLGEPVPSCLGLAQQGEFVVGYYQQRFVERRLDRSGNPTGHEEPGECEEMAQ